MTHLDRGTIFLSYCYSGRIIYDDAFHLKKFCVNPVRKEVTALSKRLGKMDMVVEKLRTFQESCGSMVQTQLQPPLLKWTPWSRCLSVCLSVCLCVHLCTDIKNLVLSNKLLKVELPP